MGHGIGSVLTSVGKRPKPSECAGLTIPDYYSVYRGNHVLLGGVMITNLSELASRTNLSELADNTSRTVAWMSGITGVLILLVLLGVLVLVIAALISTLINSDTSGGGKLLWVLFILWVPVFGAVAWFVVGRKGHLNRLLGIDKGRARHTVPSSVGQHSDVAPNQTGLGHA